MERKKWERYTKEVIQEAVSKSVSIAGVMRQLNINNSGGSHHHLSNKIKQLGIDASHFLGKRTNSGPNKRGGPAKRTPEQIMIVKPARREAAKVLRRALLESGTAYKCSLCGLGSEWNNNKITLEIDHIDCDWSNNTKENLRFLCPNCHSQRPNHSKKLPG